MLALDSRRQRTTRYGACAFCERQIDCVRACADVPTLAEAGLTGFAQDSGWHALFGPAKMPRPIVERLHEAVQKSLQVASVREFLQAGGYEPTADPPAVFQKNFIEDLARWGELARAARIEPI